MKALFVIALSILAAVPAQADVLYSQPPAASGVVLVSSRAYPNPSDADIYVYDSFIAPADAAISEVRWRGGYVNSAPYGHAVDFSVFFYESTAGGTEPLVGRPEGEDETIFFARYFTGGAASETPAGTVSNTAMYDYRFVLPAPLDVTAGVKYWIRIEGYQPVTPDWGIAAGTGGNDKNFRFVSGLGEFQVAPHDAAFTLLGSGSTAACSADVNESGSVDVRDFMFVIGNWRATSGPADVNGSGSVDVQDLIAVIRAWGPCP